jgi:hypothetical protein
MILENGFDIGQQCCFCGSNNRNEPYGYAGERCCSKCGYGGEGEKDFAFMAYKCWPVNYEEALKKLKECGAKI